MESQAVFTKGKGASDIFALVVVKIQDVLYSLNVSPFLPYFFISAFKSLQKKKLLVPSLE